MDQSTYVQLEEQAASWVSNLAGKPVQNFGEDLKSGALLCQAINGIRAGTILKINTQTATFRQLENIDNFLKL